MLTFCISNLFHCEWAHDLRHSHAHFFIKKTTKKQQQKQQQTYLTEWARFIMNLSHCDRVVFIINVFWEELVSLSCIKLVLQLFLLHHQICLTMNDLASHYSDLSHTIMSSILSPYESGSFSFIKLVSQSCPLHHHQTCLKLCSFHCQTNLTTNEFSQPLNPVWQSSQHLVFLRISPLLIIDND